MSLTPHPKGWESVDTSPIPTHPDRTPTTKANAVHPGSIQPDLALWIQLTPGGGEEIPLFFPGEVRKSEGKPQQLPLVVMGKGSAEGRPGSEGQEIKSLPRHCIPFAIQG